MTRSRAHPRASDRARQVQLAYEALSDDEKALIDYATECLMGEMNRLRPGAMFGPMQAREVLFCLGGLIELHAARHKS